MLHYFAHKIAGGGYPPPVGTKVAQTPVGARVKTTRHRQLLPSSRRDPAVAARRTLLMSLTPDAGILYAASPSQTTRKTVQFREAPGTRGSSHAAIIIIAFYI